MNDPSARIGQILWPALRASRGEAGLEALAPLLAEFPPGGVIVFGEGMERVDRLIARLRLRAGSDLLVAADLERGCGQQVREFSSLPPAMAVAACPDADAARQAGLLTALEARQAGIDVVFAPVADVNTVATNPIIATRSFGDDPHRVAALASAFAAGLAEGGVLAVGKHFPGHGSTVQDSHSELARITRSAEELEAIDLLPFRTLVAEGVGGLMVGHLEVPALDPVKGRPATRSPSVVLDLLRQRYGFSGLVITDALDMGGFPQDPAAMLDVLQAGLDVLLMPREALAVARWLREAHGRRHLPDEVLDAAVARVAAARARVRGGRPPTRRPAPELPATLLQHSLTAHGGPLPRLLPGMPVDIQVFGEDSSGMVLPALVEALEAAGVVRAPGGRRIGLVLTTVRAWLGSSRLPELDRGRLQWAVSRGQLEVVVVLGSPYEILDLPARQPALLAYEPTPAAAAAAARVLLGEAHAPGRLPVGARPAS
ncbi:MAG TPA: glycoside hydrolase family 3 N-terminal domain-containing protein [Planctomycetota bacterium]|nr:glycoside hydrolase family 3 N-terminal domain-containing protein [Planctomycetota bacterium]